MSEVTDRVWIVAGSAVAGAMLRAAGEFVWEHNPQDAFIFGALGLAILGVAIFAED